MSTMTQLSRRDVIESLAKAAAAILLAPMVASAATPAAVNARSAGPIFTQELPPVSLDGWKMTALEITYAAGQIDRAHRHIGFVFGYVLEGALRFKADGGDETTYHVGQMFYEPLAPCIAFPRTRAPRSSAASWRWYSSTRRSR